MACELFRRTALGSATILLVQTVGAIYLMIAHPGLRDALARAALELRFTARCRSTDSRILVGAIRAISVTIAMPYIRYASAIGALEVRVLAFLCKFALLRAFIGIVGTVVRFIADP